MLSFARALLALAVLPSGLEGCHPDEPPGAEGGGEIEATSQAATTSVNITVDPNGYTGELCGPGGCSETVTTGSLAFSSGWQISAPSVWFRLSPPLDGDNTGLITVSATGTVTLDALGTQLYSMTSSAGNASLKIKSVVPVTVDGTGYPTHRDLAFGPKAMWQLNQPGPTYPLKLLPGRSYEFRENCALWSSGGRPVITVNANGTLSFDQAAWPGIAVSGTTLKLVGLVPATIDMTGYGDQPDYTSSPSLVNCGGGEGPNFTVQTYKLIRGMAHPLYNYDSSGGIEIDELRGRIHVSGGGQLSLDADGLKSFKFKDASTIVPLLGHVRVSRGAYTGALCALMANLSGNAPFRCAPATEELQLVLIRERNYFVGNTSSVVRVLSNGTCSVSSIQVGGVTLAVRCGLTPPPPTLPKAPSGLTAAARAPTRVELSWADNSDNESSFQIERKLASATTFTVIGSAQQGQTTHSDTTVLTGSSYDYRVRAVNSTGASAPSNTARVVVAPPSPPAGLTGKQSGPGRVDLAWSDVSLETGYSVLRSTDGGQTFVDIQDLAANSTAFSDGAAAEGATNRYRVVAFNPVGTSAPSNTVAVNVTAPVPCGGTGPACPDPALTQFNHNTPRIDYRDEPTLLIPLDGTGARGLPADPSGGEALVRPSTSSCVGSRVDDLRWSFSQESMDFTTGSQKVGASSACAPSATRDGPLPDLQLRRFHRPRLEHTPSFFGPGVFSNFDLKLTYYQTGLDGHPNIVLFDPETDAPPVTFFERSAEDGDDLDDGTFHDRETRKFQYLYLVDGNFTPVTDIRQAQGIVLVKNDGGYVTFDTIASNAGAPDQVEGRPTFYVDAPGNFFWVAYQYSRDASDGVLGFDRSQLWKVSAIGDSLHRNEIALEYEHRPSGRWLVSTVTAHLADGTPRVYRYGYSNAAGAADTLATVTYPNGDVSHFSKAFDAVSQQWGLTFDDVGGGPVKRKKTVWVTGPTFKTGDGVVHGQTPNLVRRVANASQEEVLRLRENPNDPNVTFAVEGNRQLSRLTTDGAGAPKQVARARAVVADPMTGSYDTVESYLTDPHGLITQATDGAGKSRTLVYDPFLRKPTSLTARDGTGASWTFDGDGRPVHTVDRAGRVTNAVYDGANLASVTEAPGTPLQATTQYTRSGAGQIISKKDPLGRVTEYTYDDRAYPASVTEPPDVPGGARAKTSFQNGAFGLLLARTDALGRKTSYAYDARNRLVGTTYPDGSMATTSYGTGSLAALVVAETDRNGVKTSYEYDASLRLVKVTRAAGKPEKQEEIFEYLPGTELVGAATIAGQRTEYTYDERNREIASRRYTTGTKSLLTQKAYDNADRLVKETDPYGRSTFYVYGPSDAVVRMVREVVAGGVPAGAAPATLARITTANPPFLIDDYLRNGMAQIVSHTNPRGLVTTYAYDARGRVTEQVVASGTAVALTTRTEYDLVGNRTKATFPRSFREGRSFVTTFALTGRDLLASQTTMAGASEATTTSFTYTLTRQLATTLDGRGGVTTNGYDGNDRLATVKDPGAFVTTYAYDPGGRQTSVGNPLNQVSSFTFDGHGRPLTRKNPAGEVTSYTYDDDLTDGVGLDLTFASQISGLGFGAKARGRATLTTNPAGETNLVVEDGVHRALLSLDGNGNATKYAYDTVVSGLVESAVTNALGNVIRTRLDGAKLRRQLVDAAGKVTTMSYDAAGNLLAERDPNGVGQDCLYDEADHRTSCTDTQGDTQTFETDAAGNVTAIVDAAGGRSSCNFDGLDRRTECTDRNGATSAWAYDKNGNVVSFADAQGGITSYAYDARNLETSATFPDSSSATDKKSFAYDGARRLISRTLQNGNVITHSYDTAGRLTQRSYPDAKNDAFAYDLAGRLKSATSARYGTTLAQSYDKGGRLTKESLTFQGQTRSASRGYDAGNRLTKLTYPDATVMTRTFTSRDQLASLTWNSKAIASYTHDDAGRLTGTTLGNGLVEARTYRADDGLVSASTAGVGDLTYSYDPAKRVLSEGGSAAPGGAQAFTYDPEGRLTKWSRGTNQQSWVLSAAGDWNSVTTDSVTEARTHDAVHELTAVGSAPLSYDSRGDLTTNDKGETLSFDLESRLQKFTKTSGSTTTTVTYFYDALGRKAAKSVATSGSSTVHTTVFVSSAEDTIAEYLDGALSLNYLPGDGIDHHVALVKGGSVFWYTRNHLGTIMAVTDSTKAIKERYRYTAYGARTILSSSGGTLSSSSVGNQIGFTSRYHDKDTGLIDFRFRHYDPRLGRFTARDDDYRDGGNLYAAYFVPNATDPTGHATVVGGFTLGGALVEDGSEVGLEPRNSVFASSACPVRYNRAASTPPATPPRPLPPPTGDPVPCGTVHITELAGGCTKGVVQECKDCRTDPPTGCVDDKEHTHTICPNSGGEGFAPAGPPPPVTTVPGGAGGGPPAGMRNNPPPARDSQECMNAETDCRKEVKKVVDKLQTCLFRAARVGLIATAALGARGALRGTEAKTPGGRPINKWFWAEMGVMFVGIEGALLAAGTSCHEDYPVDLDKASRTDSCKAALACGRPVVRPLP